ncbi:MAG: YkgJ family cysteine cluster protein [Pseudomonadota bacterium]
MATHSRNERVASSAQVSESGLADVHEGLTKLHAKTDAFFTVVLTRHRLRMNCGMGCASCCHRMPSVFPVEAWMIAEGLRRAPGPVAQRMARRLVDHSHETEISPCPLLDDRGHCRVYADRPIICRSHGAPIKVPGQPADRWSVCPLNFARPGMRSQVDSVDVLDVERLNEILTVVDGLFQQAYPNSQGLPLRMPLAAGIVHFLRSA